MKLLKIVCFGALMASVTACSSVETVTRNAPLDIARMGVQGAPQIQRDYALHSIRFAVPGDLTVSESNSYYPIADIVWRGDPMGNRVEQISAIFQTAITAAGEGLTGAIPVTVDVELARFHSLTDRTRFSVGGVHSIKFDLTVRNALTGEILEPTRRMIGDVAALGGYSAMAAENAGQGQKVRITTHLTSLFARELTGARVSADSLAPNS